jgi:hypothetical protein
MKEMRWKRKCGGERKCGGQKKCQGRRNVEVEEMWRTEEIRWSHTMVCYMISVIGVMDAR